MPRSHRLCLAACPWAVLLAAWVVPTQVAEAEDEVRLPVTKDNSIVLVEKEWRDNAGAQQRIRIKGNQHLVAMMFDVSAVRGRLVKQAVLVCQKADASIDGVTISTIMADWDEMKSNSMTGGLGPTDGWGYAGARFPAVTGGNAFSLVCQAPSSLQDGAYRWPVDPDLVHALAVGAAYGLTLHEFSADYSRNPTIWSREQADRGPYLLVTLAEGDEPAPLPPADLRIVGADAESVRLRLRAPPSGFAYEVTVNGVPLGRWNTPFVEPGREQVIPIRDVPLTAGGPLAVSVVTVSRTGRRSTPASLAATVPGPKPVEFPTIAPTAQAGRPPEGLTVIPQQDKYDSAGRPVGDLPHDYQMNNPVFDGQTVRVAAARGEVVGFQALIKGAGKVTVRCDLPGLKTELWRAVYVQAEGGRRIPDPLVPLEEIDLSPQEAAAVLVDVAVPFDFAGREVAGALSVSDGRQVPILVTVLPFALPRRASFLCEMNGYGLPDRASQFYRLQELAYDHRVHVNLLAYGHRSTAPGSRTSQMDMLMDVPPLAAGEPRRMDEKRYNAIAPGAAQGFWDDFAAVFGPYLSGRHFEKGHRGPVPAPGFYLTFHESWPLRVREFFNGNPDAYQAFKDKPIYAQTFVSVLKDFLNLVRREGWTEAGLQVYLNNKGKLDDPTRAPWVLDEPASYWDYRALAYYGDLVRQARGQKDDTGLVYRIDISRPEFDRGQLTRKADLWVVSTSAMHRYHRLVADRAEREGLRFWIYGTTNKVEQTNRTVEAWVLDAYRSGACGIVPWQTINRDGSAMNTADQLGLFIFTRQADGSTAIRHSMRLKAYRSAEQTVEYLELARQARGLTPAQVRAFIDHYLNLTGQVRAAYAEDAGTPQYDRVTPESLRRLRRAAAELAATP